MKYWPILTLSFLVACGGEGEDPSDDNDIEEAAEETGEAIEEGVNETGEAFEEAGEEVEEEAEEAEEEAEEE